MSSLHKSALPLLLAGILLLLVAWIYWPGQAGPALLDDRSSVLVVGDLKNNPELAWDYVSGNRSGPLGRPVSMASFALEKLLLEDNLATSKRVNILLHLANGSLVLWLFWLLFGYLTVPGYRWLSVLLAAIWMLSPLFVSTVLYVVQRMAMLSTTFMLLACISYALWRIRLARGSFSVLYLLLILSNIFLALFAKENAVVVIPIILLLEALWFQFEGIDGHKIRWLRRYTLGVITLGAIGLILTFIVKYESLAAKFQYRPFSLEERLMTQSRVVWDYVSQFVFPDVSRMGLYHDDIVVSTSLMEPVTTACSTTGWIIVSLLLLGLMRWTSGRYIALGALWFLVGHSVESTILSLELYFEHRNYFPGIGLLLLLGVIFMLLVRSWPQVKSPLLAYLACLVVWLAFQTAPQVQIWSNHPLLILSHLNGHPNSFRANADMAVQMANLGEIEASRRYSKKAFDVTSIERSGDRDIRDLALSCIANQPVSSARFESLGTAAPTRPFSSVITLLTLVRLLQDNTCPEFDRLAFADRMVQIYLPEGSVATASANLYQSLSVLENSLQRWGYAIAYIDRFLEVSPGHIRGLLMKLQFTTALGKVDEAEALKTLLLEKDQQGKLSVGDRQILSLYLEK